MHCQRIRAECAAKSPAGHGRGRLGEEQVVAPAADAAAQGSRLLPRPQHHATTTAPCPRTAGSAALRAGAPACPQAARPSARPLTRVGPVEGGPRVGRALRAIRLAASACGQARRRRQRSLKLAQHRAPEVPAGPRQPSGAYARQGRRRGGAPSATRSMPPRASAHQTRSIMRKPSAGLPAGTACRATTAGPPAAPDTTMW